MIKISHASYRTLIRVEFLTRPGMFSKASSAIGEEGGDIGAIDIVGLGKGTIVRDMGKTHLKQIIGLVVAFAAIGLIVYCSIP